MHTAQLF